MVQYHGTVVLYHGLLVISTAYFAAVFVVFSKWVDYESCDSEAEINALQRCRWLSDEEKRRLEQEKQNKEATRAEMDKQKKAQHQEVAGRSKKDKAAVSAPPRSSRQRRNGS